MDLTLKIAEVDASITPKEFKKRFIDTQTPVIVRGLAYTQPAGGKWTPDWFKNEMGDVPLDITDNRVRRHDYSTTVTGDLTMPMKEYMDIISKDEDTPYRLFRFNLYKYKPELKQDFSCPPIVDSFMRKHGFMFFGGKNTDVRLHYDIDNSNVLLTQFYGDKRVVLIGPEYSDLLFRMPFNTHTIIDLKNIDYNQYPSLKYVKGYDFVLKPGDAVFMPSGYWHYNTYLNGGISVAYRKPSTSVKGLAHGIKNLVVMMPLDKMMNSMVGDPWKKYKERLRDRRVERAIKKFSKD